MLALYDCFVINAFKMNSSKYLTLTFDIDKFALFTTKVTGFATVLCSSWVCTYKLQSCRVSTIIYRIPRTCSTDSNCNNTYLNMYLVFSLVDSIANKINQYQTCILAENVNTVRVCNQTAKYIFI